LGRAVADAVHLQRQECRVTAAQRFTPDRMADQYLRLYRDVLVHGGGRIGPLAASVARNG